MSSLTLPPKPVDAVGPTASSPPGGPAPSNRNRRRAGAVAVVAVVVVGSISTGMKVRASDPPASASSATATANRATTTEKVTRRDLIEQTTVDGTLAYGDSTPLSGPMGAVTGVVAEGTVVERGQSVGEVNGSAVSLFYGTVPLWRALPGSAIDGADIKMLEENLQALGYADGLFFTADGHWDDATRIAVQRWQKALGREQSGSVQPGDAVVHDGPARIAKVDAKVGQSTPGGSGLVEVTSTSRTVQAKVKASQQSLVHVGDAVDIELPDSSTVKGHITHVGTVATTASDDSKNGGGGTDPTVTVDIAIEDQSTLGTLDQTPVSVKLDASAAKDVLAVPVDALLALREGGYAVQVSQGADSSLVAVRLGAFADGWVQVDGALEAGDLVVVPK